MSPAGPHGEPAVDLPRVTDGQVHVWLDPTPERPWPPAEIPPQRTPALAVPELAEAMTAAGVDRALLVPPTWEGPRNDYVLEAARTQPDRFRALCRVDAADPAAVETLADWRSWTGMVGLRMSVNRGDTGRQVQDATASGFFATAERLGIPLSLYAPGRLALVDELARRHPGLRITVDHLAIESDALPLVEAAAAVLPLAAHPNVAVKASALPCFVRESFPYPSITATVDLLVDAFGAERVFWGSDLSRLPCPYRDLVQVFTAHTQALTDAERALVLGGGLERWLSWTSTRPADPEEATP